MCIRNFYSLYIFDIYFHDVYVIEKYVKYNINKIGIEDKTITTKGYCLVLTDEGCDFFEDLKCKDVKHEGDLSMLNQLFDGKGDKMTLAQNKECAVPKISTCMTISVQPEVFTTGLTNLGTTLWKDTGFRECFLISAAQPYR